MFINQREIVHVIKKSKGFNTRASIMSRCIKKRIVVNGSLLIETDFDSM